MKVLLIGATGNIGSRLLPALLAHKHIVSAYVRDPSRLSPDSKSHVQTIIKGDGTDAAAIQSAILTHDCDAVVSCAGWAAMTGLQDQGEFPSIFEAVVKAAVEAGKERRERPIRVWFMSSFFILDAPMKPYSIGDYIPLFPAHHPNYALIKGISTSTLAWSLFCPNRPLPRHDKAMFPFPEDCSTSNLVAAADSPPAWDLEMYQNVPLLGSWFNVILQARSYYVKMEDCVDFIAADLEAGLESGWIGKRVGVKEKMKSV